MGRQPTRDKAASQTEGARRAAAPRPAADATPPCPRWHWLAVPALLALAAGLAVHSLLGDSITYDETSHLTAGVCCWKTGDFRFAPDHPPLAKMWAALPLVLRGTNWPDYGATGWDLADVFLFGRVWLYELNDGEHLMRIGRGMMVVLMLALCGAVYALGRALFGPTAGLLALVLAALCPTVLAHGRLVTTDVPITLCLTLTLLTFAALLRRVTWGRLLAAAAALGAASVTKLSWPLVLPALLVMAAIVVARRARWPVAHDAAPGAVSAAAGQVAPRRRRLALLGGIGAFLALTTWLSIWVCYRLRFSMFPPQPVEPGAVTDPTVETAAVRLAGAWNRALHDEHGAPRPGLLPTFLRLANERRLLPEAYLFGLAWTIEATEKRNAYFCGEISFTGWRSYFPVAFAIKTPIATMLLALAGLAALLGPLRLRTRDNVLLAGLLTFAGVYLLYLVNSTFNIGHRHLLPVYPAIYVLGGAAALWLKTRAGRWLVPAAVAWLAAASGWIHPHYLAYFNEFIGGPRHGHLYLADSNIDWGQDLKRLAQYARRRPDETFKLAYFGSADPSRYGFPCQLLPGPIDTGSCGPLAGGGTYVVSVTTLLGVWAAEAQAQVWDDPRWRRYYEHLRLTYGPAATSPATAQADRERALHDRLRFGRFLWNLRRRPPDERIGYSLFVYRLTAADVEELTRP